MNDALRARPCPMCGGLARTPHATVERPGARYEIARCTGCRFVFVANPGAETFDAVQNAPARVPERPRHRQIKRVCDHLLLRGPRAGGARVAVEIGAGWGGLAQVFSRDARYRYVGFEPNVSRAEYCRARGFDVRRALFVGRESVGEVDAVIFDNVLEHLYEPDALVGAAVESLRDGGVLVVIVPNLHDVRKHFPGGGRHSWQPHCHINYFSAGDLRRMFGRHGLSVRHFGLEAAGKSGDDVGLLPRVLADMAGVHLFGLNCYAVKSSRATCE